MPCALIIGKRKESTDKKTSLNDTLRDQHQLMRLYIYEETTSTSDLAKNRLFKHGDVIWAMYQTQGRGQRGNRWLGEKGENIAISIVLEPLSLAIGQQFVIAQITALALRDTMVRYSIECRIKWTNDIYIGDRKIAGVLIENSLSGDSVSRSVIGIGLNVNQLVFDPNLPNPTSMAIESRRHLCREEVLAYLYDSFMARYQQLNRVGCEPIAEVYNQYLYRKGEMHAYRLPSGELFEASIQGVTPRGASILNRDGLIDHTAQRGYISFKCKNVVKNMMLKNNSYICETLREI